MGEGLALSNPVAHTNKRHEKPRDRVLSEAELRTIWQVLGNDDFGVVLKLLMLTGQRAGEIAGLRWSEVDIERSYLRLGDSKTGAKVIPIGAPACEVLATVPAVEGTPYVFPASSGKGRFQGVERVWQKVRVAAGFPKLRLHDLRHSFASVGLARGDALPIIGAILGHADVKTTSRYAHLADDPVKRAADEISRSVKAAFAGRPSADVISMGGSKGRP